MRAFLDDRAGLHHQNALRVDDGREAMGDDERRAPLHQRLERALHERLVLGVERGGRFVQQQHRRVLEDGAGDGDALALAARDRRAALAERRIVALRQSGNEAVRRGLRAAAAIASRVASGEP